MPKAPLTSRTLLYQRLSDGTLRVADVASVETSLGTMVEWRTVVRAGGGAGVVNEDLLDSSFSGLSIVPPYPTGHFALDEAVYFSGPQWPHYRDDTVTGVGR